LTRPIADDHANVSIVVLSHNRKATIARTLTELLKEVGGAHYQLIVVDNASTDGSIDVIAEALNSCPRASFLRNDSNLGVAKGRNTGWRCAEEPYILNLDDDISISIADIQMMVRTLDEHPEIGIVAPVIVDYVTGNIQYSFGTGLVPIANFQGACHMVRRSVAVLVGYNDEECSFGGEELDLSIRVRAAGFDVVFNSEARALHDHVIRQGVQSQERRLRTLYNFVRVFNKNFPPAIALTFTLRTIASHLISGIRLHGVGFGAKLLGAASRGAVKGRRQYLRVPAGVVYFYNNRNLRPEFGNVPLWQKVWRKLVART